MLNINITVSFLKESSVELILNDLKYSDAKIRILTTDYLNITNQSLYKLKYELKDSLDLRFYNFKYKSFHFNMFLTLIIPIIMLSLIFLSLQNFSNFS